MINSRKVLASSLILLALSATQTRAVESFDFELGASIWGGVPYSDQSDSGADIYFDVTFNEAGTPDLMWLSSSDSGIGSSGFQFFHDGTADPTHDPVHPLAVQMSVSDINFLPQDFRIVSLDWQNDAENPITASTMTGLLDGVEQWTLTSTYLPAGEEDPIPTVTTSDTGSFNNFIDTITWVTPGYEDTNFGATLDNVVISFDPPDPTDPGDADEDGDVDGDDFLQYQRDDPGQIPTWVSNYPSPLGAFSSIPEPTTLASGLALLISGSLLRIRSRDR